MGLCEGPSLIAKNSTTTCGQTQIAPLAGSGELRQRFGGSTTKIEWQTASVVSSFRSGWIGHFQAQFAGYCSVRRENLQAQTTREARSFCRRRHMLQQTALTRNGGPFAAIKDRH
jgi:hypothetical protein